jgi:hypothetical protein
LNRTEAERYAHASYLRDSLQSCRNVDSISQDVVTIDDDVSEIDPDAVLDAPILWNIGVTPGQFALHLNSTLHGVVTLSQI